MVEKIAEGAWSVHQRPRSICEGGHRFIGAVDDQGRIFVLDDQVNGPVIANNLDTVFVDDHSSPSFYIRDDGRLVVFWSDRGGDSETMRWAISDGSLDITSFGAVNTFSASQNVDYPQPIPWENNLRLYHRRGALSGGWRYRESTDGGETFGSEQFVHDIDQGYTHPYKDGSKLHFAIGDHRMSPSIIGHWYLENGNYYQSDGTLIGAESNGIGSLSDVTTVADLANPVKLYDHVVHNGTPTVAFTEHVATGSGGGDGDYRARWATRQNSEWIVGSEITEMGGSMPESHYYEGGLSLDSQDPTTVYVSTETKKRNFQIQQWTTDDNGDSWRLVANLSPGDATITTPTKRGRPISPRDHDGDLNVLWFAGRYDFFEDYDTDIQEEAQQARVLLRQDGQWIAQG